MAVDCAKELKKHKVAFVSLWPGAVRTENVTYLVEQKGFGDSEDVVCFDREVCETVRQCFDRGVCETVRKWYVLTERFVRQ